MALNRLKRNSNEELQAAEDSGFGKKFIGTNTLINKDGTFNIERSGATHHSVYEHMTNVTWARFFFLTLVTFIAINMAFAFLYILHGVESLNGKPINPIQDFLNCFYFSIQTFTSVGYGFFNPQCNYANALASINAFVGLVAFALVTGMLFSRFSKARVNIMFSDNVLIAPFNDSSSLQFRIVNSNHNILMNVEATANITWLENVDGTNRRKFQRLKLELDFIKLFPLNWTIVHVINEHSPLWEKTKEALLESNTEIMVMIRAYDDTYNQNIYKNFSYHASDLVLNAVFMPMYENVDDKTTLHIDKLSAIKEVNS